MPVMGYDNNDLYEKINQHTKYFFEMAFIHIPAERINMENKWFLNRCSFPEIIIRLC